MMSGPVGARVSYRRQCTRCGHREPYAAAAWPAHVAATLNAARRREGLTYAALAAKARLAPSYTGRLLNGQARPSRNTAARLADAVGATEDERELFLAHAAGGAQR
jgi:ribosome-binding protein aMBF1 (putative translation factor)